MLSKTTLLSGAGLLLALGLASAPSAHATIYSYNIDNPDGSANAGDITNFSTSYNDVTQMLTWSSTIERHNGHLADGFWFVLSDGPNPKSNVDEYAIFYGDGYTGNLTSYVYNGANSSNSWNTPGQFIQSFAGAVNVAFDATDFTDSNEVTFSLSIDISDINAFDLDNDGDLMDQPDWDGASYADKIGIWYHPLVFNSTGATYNNDGSLNTFGVARNGWYDTSGRNTTTVPAPAVALLTLTGLAGIVGIRRRRR